MKKLLQSNIVPRPEDFSGRGYDSLLVKVENCIESFNTEEEFLIKEMVKSHSMNFLTFSDMVIASDRIKYAAYSVYKLQLMNHLDNQSVVNNTGWILNRCRLIDPIKGKDYQFIGEVSLKSVISTFDVLLKDGQTISLRLLWVEENKSLFFLILSRLK